MSDPFLLDGHFTPHRIKGSHLGMAPNQKVRRLPAGSTITSGPSRRINIRPPPTGTTMADQMVLPREQVKMLAREVTLCPNALELELKALITKLSYQNSKLTVDLEEAQDLALGRPGNGLKRDLVASHEREAALMEKEQKVTEIQKRIEEALQREEDSKSDLENISSNFNETKPEKTKENSCVLKELRNTLEYEKKRSMELDIIVSKLKNEDLDGLDLAALDELQSLHVDAIMKLCHAKMNGGQVRMQFKSVVTRSIYFFKL
eukprot:Gb_35195 [translate_table: standard]